MIRGKTRKNGIVDNGHNLKIPRVSGPVTTKLFTTVIYISA
jgi:hypothetical protein